MLKLPIDISTFSELRTSGYVYVDKTEHIYNMITSGRRYFLSRPRRFGKSLLVSTLNEVLSGHKELFDNLWIAKSNYEWKAYGVINLDFSRLKSNNILDLNNRLNSMISNIAHDYNLTINAHITAYDITLENLIVALFKKYGRVAILIDEYDNPILKTLENEALATEIRNEIQHFFTIIKSLDKYVQFVFITGVSSFAKAGLFSGINNVQIITLQDEYGAICGYTHQEVDHYFTEHITQWSDKKNIPYNTLRTDIKTWYNGYRFGNNVPTVYNPFSLMNALAVKEFKNYWFQSGAPTFLITILKKEYFTFDTQHLNASEDFLGIFDINAVPLVSLMFQTGYLTIVGYDSDSNRYQLNYPNKEVSAAFQKYLLEVFTNINAHTAQQLSLDILQAFNQKNSALVVNLLKQLFAHIPYQLHMNQEKFYHALLMMICIGAGIKAQSEYSTSHGRIDLILELPRFFYIIEIKFNKSAESALQQIEERCYYERFISQDKPIVLLGLSFKREPHNFDITYVEKIYTQ